MLSTGWGMLTTVGGTINNVEDEDFWNYRVKKVSVRKFVCLLRLHLHLSPE